MVKTKMKESLSQKKRKTPKRTREARRKKEQHGAHHQEKKITQPTANTLKNTKKDRITETHKKKAPL